MLTNLISKHRFLVQGNDIKMRWFITVFMFTLKIGENISLLVVLDTLSISYIA